MLVFNILRQLLFGTRQKKNCRQSINLFDVEGLLILTRYVGQKLGDIFCFIYILSIYNIYLHF